jgi:hypothetical protein
MKGLTEYQRSQMYAKYKQQTAKGLKEADMILKTLPLLDVLLDAIEDLQNSPMYRQKMKQHGNNFKKELLHALGVLNKSDDNTQLQSFEVMDMVEKVDTLIGNIHVSKFPQLINVLDRFNEIGEADIDTFVTNIVSRQYAKITEFHIDKKIITKLKKIMPLLDEMPLVQISQQISRDKLQNTKGFGEESIKVLNEVFSTSGIRW